MRTSLIVAGAWTLVALLFAAQGYGVARYQGSAQPWWPSLGYALAIFSIWAALTPFVVEGTRRAVSLNLPGRLFAFAVCLPITTALHVALFALVYWPVYNDNGRIATRHDMALHMGVRNFDTNALFYLLVVCCARGWQVRSRSAPDPASSEKAPYRLGPEPIRVRSRGRMLFISPADIDWVAAAGDYVELHVGNDVHLADGSLVALERLLPAGEFARIHRAILVRVDRVVEVRSLGRGDALIRLATGDELRLSRRYRSNLAELMQLDHSGDPARPPGRSRSPI